MMARVLVSRLGTYGKCNKRQSCRETSDQRSADHVTSESEAGTSGCEWGVACSSVPTWSAATARGTGNASSVRLQKFLREYFTASYGC